MTRKKAGCGALLVMLAGCQSAERAEPAWPLAAGPAGVIAAQYVAPAPAPGAAPGAAPAPPETLQVPPPEPVGGPAADGRSPAPLELPEVRRAIFASFPALYAAGLEGDIAEGRRIAAWGEFDWKVQAESLAAPEGFYKTYRHLAKLDRPFFSGGGVYGQYRLGDGNFPVWYGERETDEGGEFRVGVLRPLLRDRQIDERRAAVFKAELAQQAVAPNVQADLLQFLYDGADAYWTWVAAGLAFGVQRDLLQVTRERNRAYEARVAAGDLPPIELLQNERLIVSREAKLLDAQRKWEQAAVKLSLYLRDLHGQPRLPTPDLLPAAFPTPQRPETQDLPADVLRAQQLRPEVQALGLQRSQAQIDRDAGWNQTLPSLNAVLEAAKDVGEPASAKRDKTPLELEAGVRFEVPLQRRKGEGKIREAEAKLAQLAAKLQFTADKIANEVRMAWWARETAFERIARERRNVELAQQLVQAERTRFEAEDSDLLRVALQETAAIEASLQLLEALLDFYRADAAFRAATAADLRE